VNQIEAAEPAAPRRDASVANTCRNSPLDLTPVASNGNIAVDSNAVIAYRAGNARACAAINGSVELFMPTMVLGELLYGSLNSARPAENEKAVRAFADQCVMMAVDQAVAERYAVIRTALKKSGSSYTIKPGQIVDMLGWLDFQMLQNDKVYSYELLMPPTSYRILPDWPDERPGFQHLMLQFETNKYIYVGFATNTLPMKDFPAQPDGYPLKPLNHR